jgi:hypothetical protein
MVGLEPTIQEVSERLDGRVKPGHDDKRMIPGYRKKNGIL